MKLTFVSKVVLLAALNALLSACSRPDSDEAGISQAKPEQSGTVSLDATTQQRMGVEIQSVQPGEMRPRFAVTGRVVDVASLSAQAADFISAEAAASASQAERKRLETLASQNNASERALQAAQAAAARDQAQADAARIKLASSFGPAIAGHPELARWVQALSCGQSALVRVDLPAGEPLRSESPKASLFTLAGQPVRAEFLGAAAGVDPQTQGRSWFYIVETNAADLLTGMALSGYVEETGRALHGAIVPRSAVVRYEGEGWVYQEAHGTNFIRTQIPLDLPVDQGWFVSDGTLSTNPIVVTGSQSVLSRELNGAGFESGERD